MFSIWSAVLVGAARGHVVQHVRISSISSILRRLLPPGSLSSFSSARRPRAAVSPASSNLRTRPYAFVAVRPSCSPPHPAGGTQSPSEPRGITALRLRRLGVFVVGLADWTGLEPNLYLLPSLRAFRTDTIPPSPFEPCIALRALLEVRRNWEEFLLDGAAPAPEVSSCRAKISALCEVPAPPVRRPLSFITRRCPQAPRIISWQC